jgi:general nucleoside transport system permease protein
MANVAAPRPSTPAPSLGRAWGRISPAIVPVLAVLTALIATIPFMAVTGGSGDIGAGLNIAGTAYTALIEGSIGFTINDLASRDNFDQALLLAQSEQSSGGSLTRTELRSLARAVGDLSAIGENDARRYVALIAPFSELDDDGLTELAESIPDINAITVPTLDAMRPLIVELEALERSEVRGLAEEFAAMETLSAEERAALEAVAPSAADYSDEDLLAYMGLVNEYGIVRLTRLVERTDALTAAGIDPASEDAAALAGLVEAPGGVSAVRASAETVDRLTAAGITDLDRLSEQLDLIRGLYSADLLTDDDVSAALANELDTALADNLVVRRPGNRLLIDNERQAAGIIYTTAGATAASTGSGASGVGGTSGAGGAAGEGSASGETEQAAPAEEVPEALVTDAPGDQRPEAVYLRLGGSALIFFPYNLEDLIVRSIPFVIAGLAVALGFKAGLFNIGAEGQLYMGSILAVWVGFSPIFAGLPLFIHVPLMLVVGILGGALWGAVPGALKAYTGAHEVIVTIMLNYVAIRFVDWIIKSTNPVILADPTASTPRTPFINPSAVIPRFNEISPTLFLIAGIAVMLVGLWLARERIQKDVRAAIRPVVWGIVTAVGGLFLGWVGAQGRLHLGFVVMLFAVWFTDWFLNRTTPGFELRTVGTNPNAAKYAGMSVRRNLIFAMALSGALAGLAGTIEISGVQFNMKPDFFAGVGFDAIAVALLARQNPRNMIFAGFLWGALLSGAGLMQVRADISIDLVRIIQALIIMFIAADAIIRYLWRVPKPSESTTTTFSKGWGS